MSTEIILHMLEYWNGTRVILTQYRLSHSKVWHVLFLRFSKNNSCLQYFWYWTFSKTVKLNLCSVVSIYTLISLVCEVTLQFCHYVCSSSQHCDSFYILTRNTIAYIARGKITTYQLHFLLISSSLLPLVTAILRLLDFHCCSSTVSLPPECLLMNTTEK